MILLLLGRHKQYLGYIMSIFDSYQSRYESFLEEEYSLQEYLNLCKEDDSTYSSAAERMLQAIGKPELIDTANDER